MPVHDCDRLRDAWWRRLPHEFAELSRVGDDVLELHRENLNSGTVSLKRSAAARYLPLQIQRGSAYLRFYARDGLTGCSQRETARRGSRAAALTRQLPAFTR